MTPALKLLLTRLELALSERLQPLDKGNDKLAARLQTLRADVAKGEAIEVRNPPRQILTEAQAKESRFMLEDLHAQIVRATRKASWNKPRPSAGYRISSGCWPSCTSSSSPTWASRRCSRTSRSVHAGLRTRRPAHSTAAGTGALPAQLKQLEALLEHANALVLKNEVHKADESSELAEGMKAFDDDLWKKNNVY